MTDGRDEPEYHVIESEEVGTTIVFNETWRDAWLLMPGMTENWASDLAFMPVESGVTIVSI